MWADQISQIYYMMKLVRFGYHYILYNVYNKRLNKNTFFGKRPLRTVITRVNTLFIDLLIFIFV